MNVEDGLKYLPSILVRKRFDSDTQAPLATRTTGIIGYGWNRVAAGNNKPA